MTEESGRAQRALYAAVWRWHFYAGLYAAPFLVALAFTGFLMLVEDPIERWQYPALTRSTALSPVVTHQGRLDAARAAVPGATFVRYRPGRLPQEPTRVSVEVGGEARTIYVDEGTGRVLGTSLDAQRIGRIAHRIHSTLLIGETGDRLIEIAAGFGILLLVSGLYLWLPRDSWWSGFRIGPGGARIVWRDIHKVAGVLLAPVLLFYLVSGMAWTGIWGGRLVQSWGTFPPARFGPTAVATHDHAALNSGSAKVVPWGLEQTPLPGSERAEGERDLTLDEAIAVAQRNGIGPRFWVGVPGGRSDVWTIAQTTMSAEIVDPRQELTLHLDRRTGAVLGRAAWRDYGLGARAMATGVPLHMGYLGLWNTVASGAVCVLVLLLAISGPVMWWLRRPARALRLAAPPAPAHVPAVTWVVLVVLSLAFPLVALALLAVALVDYLIVRRVPALRALLN